LKKRRRARAITDSDGIELDRSPARWIDLIASRPTMRVARLTLATTLREILDAVCALSHLAGIFCVHQVPALGLAKFVCGLHSRSQGSSSLRRGMTGSKI
jgi:hypothetical protein